MSKQARASNFMRAQAIRSSIISEVEDLLKNRVEVIENKEVLIAYLDLLQIKMNQFNEVVSQIERERPDLYNEITGEKET